MSIQLQAQAQPDWLSSDLYPFQSRYAKIDGQDMHYIDEGKGEAVVFVHGTPTWSFLWREMIQSLSAEYRCIAPDHIGFGLSGKEKSYPGRAETLANNLETFLESLNLDSFTLVVHDFGGPIGLSYAIKHPEKVKRVVMFNTWMWETASDPEVQKIDRILKGAMGKFLYRRLNFSPKFLLKKGFYDKKKLSKTVHRHYTRPFPKASLREGPYQIGLSLKGSSDWFAGLWEQRANIVDKAFLVLWGNKDAFFQQRHLQRWQETLGNYRLREFECGHFPQEEFPQEVISEMKRFLSED